MSSAVPALCCIMADPLPTRSSLSVYRGANETAAAARILVQDSQPLRGVFRIYREDEVFQVMYQYDCHYGKSAQGIHHLYAWALCDALFYHLSDN